MEQLNPVKKKKMIVDLPGGRQVVFEIAENIEDLITDLSDEDKVPCWADIWPAAHGLAHYLWEEEAIGPGKRIMELGAGMGLPGIVCALKGAEVTLSDFNPTALEMAAENARQNGIKVRLLQEDWRSFRCREQFDFILASDILYDPKLNPFLGQVFSQSIHSGGTVLVAHPHRKATREFIEDCAVYGLREVKRELREIELTGTLLPRYKIVINALQPAGHQKDRDFSSGKPASV